MEKFFRLPLINVRDLVLFPEAYQRLYIRRTFTIHAINQAKRSHQGSVIVVTQKAGQKAKPLSKLDMYTMGTVCRVKNSIMLSDGTMKALLVGERTVKIKSIEVSKGVRYAKGFILSKKQRNQKITEKIAMRS